MKAPTFERYLSLISSPETALVLQAPEHGQSLPRSVIRLAVRKSIC